MVEPVGERATASPTAPLFEHQVEIIKTAQGKKYYALFCDMGTGKTRCAIELIKSRPVLVIAPNTILENWQDEIKHWSSLTSIILQGTKAKRIKLLKEPADVYIINYEALRLLEEELIKKKFQMIIADESQKIKGFKTLQSKSAFRIGQNVGYRLILTGTPVTNSPLDIFAQYRFLKPDVFGISYYRFRYRYAIMGGFLNKQVTNYINLDELHRKVYSCAIRIKKEDCLSLPDKLYQTHQVDMNDEQARVYKQLRTEFISELKGKTVTAPYVLTRLIRLSQVTAGFIKDETATEINFDTNPKLILLKELIEALPEKEKIVIFCRFIKEIHNVVALCIEMNWPWTGIWGETVDRQDKVKEFNDGAKIFIGQLQTAGLGINLQVARYCVFLSNSYSHGERLQCEDRLHRIGQSHNVTYIDIVARGSIDLTILKCLKEKKDLATQVIEEVRNEPLTA